MSMPAAARKYAPERWLGRSEEHTSELQSRGLISYAVFCLKKKYINPNNHRTIHTPTHTYMHTYRHTYIHRDIHAWMHAYRQTFLFFLIHTDPPNPPSFPPPTVFQI